MDRIINWTVYINGTLTTTKKDIVRIISNRDLINYVFYRIYSTYIQPLGIKEFTVYLIDCVDVKFRYGNTFYEVFISL